MLLRSAVKSVIGAVFAAMLCGAEGTSAASTNIDGELLYSFNDTNLNNDGEHPYGVVTDRKGNLYGVTYSGGRFNSGTMYSLDASGKEVVLHNFNRATDGAWPVSQLTFGIDGRLYGTTTQGGRSGGGTIFRISPDGRGFKLLHSFDSTLRDLTSPYTPSGLILGSDGNFYGTTQNGGVSWNTGTVFQITPAGKIRLLHKFGMHKAADGTVPIAPLIEGNDGWLYGTTSTGSHDQRHGTIFRVNFAGEFETLHSFSVEEGSGSRSPLLEVGSNVFYGVNEQGGAKGAGTAYKMAADRETTLLHTFMVDDKGAINPYSGLTLMPDGNLYGTTDGGGQYSGGTLYRMSPEGDVKILVSFVIPFGDIDSACGEPDFDRLTVGVNGALLGTCVGGGEVSLYGGTTIGAVFSFTP